MLLKAFGSSHGRVSWITGKLSLAVGVSAPIAGGQLGRIDARWVMGASALIVVLGLFCASRANGFGIELGASTWRAAAPGCCQPACGANKILWATDYPHPDGFFPGAPKMIAEKLPESMRRTVLAESAMQFYGMN